LEENEGFGGAMKRVRRAVIVAAWLVFLICGYTFLLGNKVFEGRFDNDPISWYFLAKGVFCALALYLLVHILEAVTTARRG